MSCRDFILIYFIKYLVEGVELWLFNYNKREILYDDKNNQSFKKDWFIKRNFKNFKIKLLSILVYLSLTIKLS